MKAECQKCGIKFSESDPRGTLLPKKWQLHLETCEIYRQGLKEEMKFLKKWGRK
jgi:hypothetical protein